MYNRGRFGDITGVEMGGFDKNVNGMGAGVYTVFLYKYVK